MIKCWSLGYEKSKEKARKIYKKIGIVECPIFNDELIAFTSSGFNHLIRKGRIPRTRNEQKKRFVLLKHAERIVKKPSSRVLLEYEEREVVVKIKRYGQKILVKKKAKFWAFIEKIDGCKIKLVVGQVGNGDKKFISIMGNNVVIRKKNKKSSK